MRLFHASILGFFAFAPLVKVGDTVVNSLLFIGPYAIIAFLVLLQNGWRYQEIDRLAFDSFVMRPLLFYVLAPWLLLVFYLFFISALLSDFKDNSFLKMSLYSAFICFVALYICMAYFRRYYSRDRAYESILNDLLNVSAIHSVVMILFFLFPSTISWFDVLIVVPDQLVSAPFVVENRSFGLSSYGGATLSVFYASLILMDVYLLRLRKTNYGFRILRLSLLYIGILLSGRTGYILLLFMVIIMLLAGWLSHQPRKPRLSRTGLLVLPIGIVLAVLARYAAFAGVFRRSFEFVYRLLDEGQFRTDSTDALLGRHFFLPTSPQVLSFGSGNFGRSTALEYLASDPGIIRAIWGGGIVGLVLLLLPYFCIVLLSIRYLSGNARLLVVGFSLLGPVLCLKEVFFLGTFGITQTIWIVILSGLFFEHQIWVFRPTLSPAIGPTTLLRPRVMWKEEQDG